MTQQHTDRAIPEVWGGVECTVNRVADEVFDQLELTGHASRIADLDHIAALGIRTPHSRSDSSMTIGAQS